MPYRVGLIILWSGIPTLAWAGWYDTPNQAEGFYFYGPPKPIRVEETSKQEASVPSSQDPAVYPYTAQLKHLKAKLEETLSQAILWPTASHIYTYQKAQKSLLARAEKFSLQWIANLYRYPTLDHTLRSPVNQMARSIYYANRQQARIQSIHTLSKEYGLFFFFSQHCQYCHQMAPPVKQFADDYGWKVLAITLDGGQLPEFPDAQQDQGQAHQWGVTRLPALLAVNPNTQHVVPLAYGLISLAELEQRTAQLVKEHP